MDGIANDSQFGLNGSVLTHDHEAAYRIARRMRTGAVAQFLPCLLVTGALAWATEDRAIDWSSGAFVFALGWLVLVLSLGAVSLLNWLIRNSNAVNIASLFYLVPPCTAVFAWLLFGETLSGQALLGMGLAVLGVYLARPPAKA